MLFGSRWSITLCLQEIQSMQYLIDVDRQAGRWGDRQTDGVTDRQMRRQTDKQTDEKTDRQMRRQTDKQADEETDRQADR